MFLSTTSMMFLSTAYLCLKGPSDLPSLLPTRECLDMAKQKNHRVRLLCKGLDHFREALYSEPMVDATSKKDGSAPVAASSVAEVTADKESDVSANTVGDQATRSSAKKPCTFHTADGGELFKTLYPAKKTPPTSPAVASSSTAVDPSSRKVSPSGSDIKDFADPSSDNNDALDPTPIVETNTKKELLKHLKKKHFKGEDFRKVVKLAAENEALNAELTSANATVRNRDAQTDLTKTYANAMILSNIVLRQAVLDVGHQLSNDNPKGEAFQKHLRIMDAVSVSAHRDMARLELHSAGQGQLNAVQNIGHDTTEEKQPKSRVEESKISNAPEIQRPSTVANLKDVKSANRTVLNDHKQRRIKSKGQPAEEIMEQGEANLEMITADLHRKESAVREGQEILHTIATTSEGSVSLNLEWNKSSGEGQVFRANKGSPPPPEGENLVPESRGDDAVTQKPTEDALVPHNNVQGTGSSATYEFSEPAGPATLWGILQSNHTAKEMGPEGDNDDRNDVQGTNSTSKGDTSTKHEFSEPAGPATLWGILQPNQTSGEFDTEGNQKQATDAPEPTSDDIYGQDLDCGRGEEVSATYEFSEPAGPATMWGILQSNEIAGEIGLEGDADDYNDVQGAKGDTNTIHEFLVPAGPATMWGILQSNQKTEETGPEGDETNGTAAEEPVTDETDTLDHAKAVDSGYEGVRSQVYEFSEPSGAATLWGILHSNQTDTLDHAKVVNNGCEGGLNQDYEFSEPSGAATLWGILDSNHGEFSESTDPTTLCGTLQSSPCEGIEDNSALADGEPRPGSGSNESSTDQETGDQEPEIREPEVEELTMEPAQEEDHTQSKAIAGEETAPEAGPAPQVKDTHFDETEIDVGGAQGSLSEPQGVSEIETSASHEAACTPLKISQDDFGNDENFAEQGTGIAITLDVQSESNQSTIVQGQGDLGLIDIPFSNERSVPLDKDSDIPKLYCPEEEIAAPATPPDTSGSDHIRYRDEIEGELILQSSAHDISTQPARTHSLPEPEVFDFPCSIPKPRSEAEIKAERKKAEHKRYKAKKKAEAAAKLSLKDEEKKKETVEEVEALKPLKTLVQSGAVPCAIPKPSSKSDAEIKAENKNAERKRYKGKKKAQAAAKRRLKENEGAEGMEPLEPSQTLAQIQAEEDMRLAHRRLELQAKRQEQQEKAASLRGVVRASRAHLIY